MNEKPIYKVCVLCNTFNQASYIKDTMDGFCMQQTNFPFVCLIMDDRYFDSGMFRTSSAPVTNKVDDRKMCVIHSDDEELKMMCFVL